MLVLKSAASSQGTMRLFRQYMHHTVCSVSYTGVTERMDAVNIQNQGSLVQLHRRLHVSSVNRDLEAGLKSLGAGIAATGVVGSGIGIGLIFGNLLNAVARNPSTAGKVFTNAIMGAAFCESLGLFAIAVAFIIMA